MPVNRCDPLAYNLGSNLSATGNPVAIPGGEYMFFAEGVPVGATTSLQFQAPFTTTWIDVQVFNGSPVKSATLPFSQTASAGLSAWSAIQPPEFFRDTSTLATNMTRRMGYRRNRLYNGGND